MNKKSKIVNLLCISLLLISLFTLSLYASAKQSWQETHGYLNVKYHYVPILNDTADASTSTNIGSMDSLWTETTVYAYSGTKGSSNTGKTYGAYALEGRGTITAKIRSMDRANGVHKGGGDEGSATAYTSWKK